MKAIILSAGQGRRMLPLTAELPKCALRLLDKTIIEWQLDTIFRCGIDDIVVVVGYGAEKVEALLADRYGGRVRTLFNPFFSVSDNLASCWTVRHEMGEDFLLLNGDTLFETEVLRRLLAQEAHPVTVTTDCKPQYDADDMKVIRQGERLIRIGKDLPLHQVNAESIGMLLFRGNGPELFRTTIEQVLRRPEGLRRWFLSVIDEMARWLPVWTCSIEGLRWAEVDCPDDLLDAELAVQEIAAGEPDRSLPPQYPREPLLREERTRRHD